LTTPSQRVSTLRRSRPIDLAANGGGCDGLKRGGRAAVLAMALLVIAIGLLVATASRAQTITSTNPPFDPAPCPKPNLPGSPELDLDSHYHCGYLTVPLDHAYPAGPTLKIAVARVQAVSPNPKPDPIVYLTGGPGVSGLIRAPGVVARGVSADRDVIFVDQRSTLHADPFLNCPEIDTFNVALLGLAPTAASTQAAQLAATDSCHARLRASGYNLAAFDTAQNAADIADLRTALGIKEWNIYGVSYGSDLALTILRDHPAGVRSLVVDGVVPPQSVILNDFWPDAATGYETLIKACEAQPACNAAYPNLRRELVDAVNTLDRHPLTVTVPATAAISALAPLAVSADNTVNVVFDGYQMANLLVQLSFGGKELVYMPAIVHGLAHGDGTRAATLLQQVATGTPAGSAGYPLLWGVFCREQMAFTSPAALLKSAQRALPGFPTSTLRLAPQIMQPYGDCKIWNVGKAGPKTHEMTKSGVPVLLLSGTFDLITAPREARVAAQGLSNAHIVDIPGVGHNTVRNSACAAQVMVDFLNDPGPNSNTACVDSITIPPFKVPPFQPP
jgi:pimeloyl-ACP methyl ester carboxylesterase